MKIAVLRPQLGVPFKNSGVEHTNNEDNLPEIRQFWAGFYENLCRFLDSGDYRYELICEPLWRFTEDYINALDCDLVFVPHKNSVQYPHLNKKALFVMQSVFPHLFTVDKAGWGGTSSEYPFSYLYGDRERAESVWNDYRARAERNISKFEQPGEIALELPERYAVFLCQLPHDETIQYHSDVSVEEALGCTLAACADKGVFLVVKGHPVNKPSMEPLKEICRPFTEQGKARYIDNVSIHQLFKQCCCVFTVNSGAGFEALLHERPVYTFGRSEYESAAWPISPESISRITFTEAFREERAKRILDAFVHHYAVDATGFGGRACERLTEMLNSEAGSVDATAQ